MLSYQFLLGIILAITSSIAIENDPVVCVKNGCIRGKNMEGNLRPFEGFFGIPYAKPPIDDLRLRDPQPIDDQDFDGTFNATNDATFCMQKNYLIPNPTVEGVEDCLHLHVYRPKAIHEMKSLLPVVIYIHGGGFFAGTASPYVTGADYFMDSEDVIFVAMNYRLGPLGFLSTGDSEMSGNFGLKDQAMAIEWVKRNIKNFGGDDENLTIMGQSAGGASVQLHMMSNPEWSRNLFHRAVLLSGNGNAPWAYIVQNPMEQARKFAMHSGIKDHEKLDSQELAEELRKTKPEDLVNACDHFKIWSVDPMTISRPVVENCEITKGFLCDNPIDLWRDGNYAKVPILSGFMDGDGGVRALAIYENKTQLAELNMRFNELLPKLMEIDDKKNEQITKSRGEKLRQKYFRTDGIIKSDGSNLIRLYTHRSFLTPLYNMYNQLVKNDRETSAYLYKFSFKSSLSYSVFYTGNPKDYGFGPVHCDELIYLLKSPLLFQQHQDFSEDSKESKFRKMFVKFFTSFASNGIPPEMNERQLERCRHSNVRNSASTQLKCNFAEFNDDLTVSFTGELDPRIAEFWNGIDDKIKRRSTKIDVKQIVKRNDEEVRAAIP